MTARVGGIRIDIALKLSSFQKSVAQLNREMYKVKKGFDDFGKNLSKSLTAPLAAVGTASFAAAKSYSAAFKEMQRTTGATGQELKSLEQNFKNVFTKSARGPSDVAQAMTRVRAEIGASGKILESLTETVLNLSTITGTDLNRTLESTLGVLDNWNIATEDGTEKLNTLYGVSQKTGVGVAAIADEMKLAGPTLRAFGVNFEDAASMVGLLADKGLNVEKFFASLDKLPKKIKDVKDLGAVLDYLIKSAGGKGDSGLFKDIIAAFGGKGATTAAESLKLLRSELGKTAKSVKDSGADINKTMADTAGIGDKLQNLKNIVTDALVPIGEVILKGVKPALDSVKPDLEKFGTWLKSISPDTLAFSVKIAGLVALMGPLAWGIGQVVSWVRMLSVAFNIVLKLLPGLVTALGPGLSAAIAVGVGVWYYFGDEIVAVWDDIGGYWDDFIQTITGVWTDFQTSFTQEFPKLTEVVASTCQAMKGVFTGYFSWLAEQYQSVFQFQHDTVASILNSIGTGISNILSSDPILKSTLKPALDGFSRRMTDAKETRINGQDTQQIVAGVKGIGDSIPKLKEFVMHANGASDSVKTLKTTTEKTSPTLSNLADYLDDGGKSAKELERKAKEAASALEDLQSKLDDTMNESIAARLKDNLSEAIEKVDVTAFEKLKEQYLTATRDGIMLGFKEATDKAGPEGLVKAQQIAAIEVADERMNLEERLAKKLEDEHKKAYEESVEFWRNSLENAITGETFNLADTLKQVAVGFGADIAASMSQGAQDGSSLISQLLKGSKSPQDIGGKLAQYLFGGQGKSGVFSNISFNSYDEFMNGTDVSPGGIWPEDTTVKMGGLSDAFDKLSTDVFAGANTMGAYASAGIASIDSLKKLNKGTEEAADGITEMAFAAAGAYFGGPVGAQAGKIIGDYVGDWVGSQFSARRDPEAIARHDITGKLEELIDKVGGLNYFDQSGQMQNVSNIVLGDSNKFNKPGWANDMFTEFGDQATQAFVGVGTAITQLLGITEDVGSQIGNILIEQFNGDTEALKALVQTAGLTYDQFVEFLMERGKQGQETWLAIIGEVNAGAEAFKEGLTGQGQYVQAFQNLLDTAGRGQLALNQIRNIAIEGAEAGITSLDSLRRMLTESGNFTAQEIDALFAAFQSIGVDSIEKLKGATDLELARIVASMDAFFQDHGSQWSKAASEVAKYEDALNALNGKKIDVSINLRSNFDENTEKAIDNGLIDSGQIKIDTKIKSSDLIVHKQALGGVLNTPTFVAPGTLAGEAGPEGLLPLKLMSNGRLGVHADFGSSLPNGLGGTNIYVDARGADIGVEQRLNSLFASMEDRIMERTVSVILESGQRGGLRGYF